MEAFCGTYVPFMPIKSEGHESRYLRAVEGGTRCMKSCAKYLGITKCCSSSEGQTEKRSMSKMPTLSAPSAGAA